MGSDLSKLMLIRFSSLGDVVLATSALEALVDQAPNCEIWLATKDPYLELFGGDPRISRIVHFSKHDLSNFIHLLRKAQSIRNGFDATVDLQSDLRSFIFSHLLDSRYRVRFHKGHLERRRMLGSVAGGGFEPRSVVQGYIEALRHLGIRAKFYMPRIHVIQDARENADRILKSEGVREIDRIVAINPGAKWPTKRWLPERFARVCDLFARDSKVIILGDDSDRSFVSEILSKVSSDAVILTGKLTLKLLAAVLEKCDVLLTNDSGPMHLAEAVGTPVVAVFGPTHPYLGFAPVNPRSRVLSAELSCSPCSLHGERSCRYDKVRCMGEISANAVISELRAVLEDVRCQ